MTAIPNADLALFIRRLRSRLAVGSATYGQSSFARPVEELVDELQQEVEDIAGWGLVLWVRLERMREHVARVAAEGGQP